MKRSLLILTGAALAAAAVFASSSLRAAPGPSKRVAKSACGFASLPRATSVGEQSFYGHIRSLKRSGRRYLLRFDPEWFLTGATASQASLEDTGTRDVPNDVYLRDESHRLLTFLVPASAHVTVLQHATCSTAVSVARLARSIPPAGFWLRVRIDTVRSIDQQYHP
jgi:hypothetical protein